MQARLHTLGERDHTQYTLQWGRTKQPQEASPIVFSWLRTYANEPLFVHSSFATWVSHIYIARLKISNGLGLLDHILFKTYIQNNIRCKIQAILLFPSNSTQEQISLSSCQHHLGVRSGVPGSENSSPTQGWLNSLLPPQPNKKVLCFLTNHSNFCREALIKKVTVVF